MTVEGEDPDDEIDHVPANSGTNGALSKSRRAEN